MSSSLPTEELIKQFLFDYNMNTSSLGNDGDEEIANFVKSVKYLLESLLKEVEEQVIGEAEDSGDARIEHYKLEPHQTGVDVPRVDFVTRNALRLQQTKALNKLKKKYGVDDA